MTIYKNAEAKFLQAEHYFEADDILKAKVVLEEIILEDPDYGRAYNHLAWIYWVKFDNYALAEKLFRLAIQFSPEYPAAYLNYTSLLLQLGKYDALEEWLEKAEKVPGVHVSSVAERKAKVYEITGRFMEAIAEYIKAIKHSENEQLIVGLKNDLERCRRKQGLFTKVKTYRKYKHLWTI